MIFKWKIFKLILFVGLILSVVTITGWLIFYFRIGFVFNTGNETHLLFIALFVSVLFTIFQFWMFKKKYPHGHISNKVEGITYLFALMIFLSSLYFLFYGGMFTNSIVNNTRPPTPFVTFSKYLSIETATLAIVYIYLGVNSLLLIREIMRNRSNSLRQISEIGRV